MIQVEFIFNNTITPFQVNLYSPFQYAIDAFIQQSLLDKNLIYFTLNGEIIDPQQQIISKLQNMNIQSNKIQIFVNSRYNNNNNQMYNPNYQTKYTNTNTLTSVSSMSDTSYQSSSYNSFSTPYNSKLNVITIIYKIPIKGNKLNLFNAYFVKNNKNKCYLLLDGNKINLCEYLQLNDALKKLETLEIKLIEVEPMTDIGDIFRNVKSLISLPDISNLNTSNVTKMRFMFSGCSSLKYLPPFLNWDISHVTVMVGIFDGCSELTTLPDISNWDLRNAEDIRYMFGNCSSLISIPDISRWDTRKVKDISYLFFKCPKLIST